MVKRKTRRRADELPINMPTEKRDERSMVLLTNNLMQGACMLASPPDQANVDDVTDTS